MSGFLQNWHKKDRLCCLVIQFQMEILKSNKGGSKLCFEGYTYTRHALRKTKQWWKCTLKSSQGCRGSLSTDLHNENPVPSQPHNHAPQEDSANLIRCRNNMNHKAESTFNKPSQIFAECVSTTSNAVKAMLPTEDNVKRSIRRRRPQLPVPASLQELTVPPELSVTVDDDPQTFLLHDNGPEARTRIIAFATDDNLRHLAAADTLYMDGTFDTAPPLFKQIFTIRIPFGNTFITVVYSLLQKKSRQAYEELFQAIIDKCNNMGLQINITKVVTDFEDGLLRATSAVFGRQVEHQGCFYHLTQATWRKIQKFRLATHYMSDPVFRHFCNTLDALAFLPIEDLPEGIAYIRRLTPEEPAETADLVDYFDATYVSGTYRPVQQLNADQQPQLMMRRTPPMFQPAVWSVHKATMECNPRTNNVCEGWNNKFYTLVGTSHPSIWTVLKWFQREQSTVTTIVLQDAIGTQPAKRVPQKIVHLQKRLQNLCQDRVSGRKTVPEFLNGVAFNICLGRRTTAAGAELDVSN